MRGLIGSVLVAVLLGGFTEAVAQLPPEIMADRYLVQAERLMKEKDYKAALEAMEKIVALQKEHDLKLPDEFHFKYAQIAMSAGLIEAAIDAVSRYLVAAGRTGKFYREALELLDQAEKKQPEGTPILPEMVVIPGGRFRMGCVSGLDCQDDEKPVHQVRVASFALSKYEVTFEEYDRFTDATGRRRADDEGWGRGRRPVTNVSWEDAVAYTEWLSDQTGEALPACRPRPSGSMRRGRGRGRSIAGGMRLAGTGPIAMAAAVSGTMRRRRRWVRSAPTPLDFTTCTATCGSGCRTAGTTVIRGRPRTARPGPAGTAKDACCAAAPGPTYPGTSVPPTASGTPPAIGTTTSVSVWPGRSPLESLTLYLGGPGGWPPGRFFARN